MAHGRARWVWMAAIGIGLSGCAGGPPAGGSAQATQPPPEATVEPEPPAEHGAAEAQAAAAPSVVPAGAVGSAHPALLVDVAADGRWVVLCQARADTDGDGRFAVHYGYHGDTFGDALAPYLVVGEGEGIAIEGWLGGDADGRHVGFVEDGHVQLLDTHTGHRVDLTAEHGALAEDDGHPFGAHRAAVFDDAGQLLFLRPGAGAGASDRLMVHTLASGESREVATGEGLLWRVYPAPGGHWAWVSVLVEDTDHSGTLSPPDVGTTLAGRQCRGPVASYSTFGGASGDEPELRLVALDGSGTVRPADDALVAVLGRELLVREADGALALEAPDGTRAPLVEAACAARVLAVSSEHGALAVVCNAQPRPEDGRVPLRVVRRGDAAPGEPLAWLEPRDEDSAREQRFVVFSDTDSRGIAVDLASAGAVTLGVEEWDVAGWYGARLLTTRTRSGDYHAPQLSLSEPGAGTSEVLPVVPAAYAEIASAGPWVAFEAATGELWRVDLRDATMAGPLAAAELLAVATSGEVLVPAPLPALTGRVSSDAPMGPLYWHDPAAPPAAAALPGASGSD